ncbi:MAG: helix-turn-helix domain-containing protein [Stenotrophomonas rhizophila]|jgi:excisionase family DNA binding protein|uniref:helix-turn-helix domain-containing protein n=1 Tax=Stenotrophomonas rhizophila TaxID=216778 RepID=UPI0028AD3B69|nr:helix-turn-helix domain-containing protein [Stenotrophomonas rhizophila]
MGAAERLPDLFTEEQAAAYLGVAEVTLRRRRAAGEIGFTRIGRQARYTETHLLNYLEQQTCQPASVSATTGSSNAKAQPSGIGRGATPRDASSALRLAQEILTKPR